MRVNHAFLILVSILVGLGVSTGVSAQNKRAYHNGSVWELEFIRMNAGMETTYLAYIADEWKREREVMKKEGQILSYKVMQTEAHDSTDYNLILMTEYKDLASLGASQEKEDVVNEQVVGSVEKQRQGYRDRQEIRRILGSRIAREIVLEPMNRQSGGAKQTLPP